MKIKDIKKAPYNPRKMSKDARSALRTSLQSFDDISGIVINETTGNIVSGNHRWDELLKIHGKRNCQLVHLHGDYYSLDGKNGPTGFIVRVVQWEEEKEKAANVTANNDLLHGEFTTGLQDVLSELNEIDFGDGDLFKDLKLDELVIDLSGLDDEFSYSEEEIEHIQEQAQDNAKEMEQDLNLDAPKNVKELKAEIKLIVPDDLKDKVKTDMLEFLAGQYYYGQIVIV